MYVQQQSKSTGLFITPVWTRSLQFVLTLSTLLAGSPWKCLINDVMYFMTCSYMACKWWLAKTQCAIHALEMVQIVCDNVHTFNYRHIGDRAEAGSGSGWYRPTLPCSWSIPWVSMKWKSQQKQEKVKRLSYGIINCNPFIIHLVITYSNRTENTAAFNW